MERSKKELRNKIVEATSKLVGTYKQEAGKSIDLQSQQPASQVGDYLVDNKAVKKQGFFARVKNIKSGLVAAFSGETARDAQYEANLKLMDRKLYNQAIKIADNMFDETGKFNTSGDFAIMREDMNDMIIDFKDNHQVDENATLFANSLLRFKDTILNEGSVGGRNKDEYLAELNQANDQINDQGSLETLRVAGNGWKTALKSAICLLPTKVSVGFFGVAAIAPAAAADAAIKASIEAKAAKINIDRRAEVAGNNLDQEIAFLITNRDGKYTYNTNNKDLAQLPDTENKEEYDSPLFVAQQSATIYKNMRDAIIFKLNLNPPELVLQNELDGLNNISARMNKEMNYVVQYYKNLEKVLTSNNNKTSLSAANYYAYQGISESVQQMVNQVATTDLTPELLTIVNTTQSDGSIKPEIDLSNTLNNFLQRGVDKTYQVVNGQLIAVDGPKIPSSNLQGQPTEYAIVTKNKKDAIRQSQVGAIAQSSKEAWNLKSLGKSFLFSCVTSMMALGAKGMEAIVDSESMQGVQRIGVNMNPTEIMDGVKKVQELNPRLELGGYIRTKASEEFNNALNPEFMRGLTDPLGLSDLTTKLSQRVAQIYTDIGVNEQAAQFANLAADVKKAAADSFPAMDGISEARFRPELDMGSVGKVIPQEVSVGGKVFPNSIAYDFNSTNASLDEALNGRYLRNQLNAELAIIAASLLNLAKGDKQLKPNLGDNKVGSKLDTDSKVLNESEVSSVFFGNTVQVQQPTQQPATAPSLTQPNTSVTSAPTQQPAAKPTLTSVNP